MIKLPGNYIAGFVDGEGCFALKFRKETKYNRGKRNGIRPTYFYWDIEFAIVLKKDDKDILEKIKNTLDCGKLSESDKYNSIRYAVNDIIDLSNKILPFFQKYPLHAKKRFDFELWKEAVAIFKRNQRLNVNRKKGERGFYKTNWNFKDLERLKEIHEEMKKYKGDSRSWKWLNLEMTQNH